MKALPMKALKRVLKNRLRADGIARSILHARENRRPLKPMKGLLRPGPAVIEDHDGEDFVRVP